jgi:cobalt-precorrin 5A hydrolase
VKKEKKPRAVFALTPGGLLLAEKLRRMLPGTDVFTLPGYENENSCPMYDEFRRTVHRFFPMYLVLVFVMACGIVVRVLAPGIQHKSRDPGVVVIDEKGGHVISLLSGHLGNANNEAKKLAGLLGACPVITTASDVLGKTSVDVLAMKYGLTITDFPRAKKITALMVAGKKVVLTTPCPMDIPPEFRGDPGSAAGIIRVSYNPSKSKFPGGVHLLPKNLILGIGCRKGTSCGKIFRFVRKIFRSRKISPGAIKKIASVDMKKNEPGLVSFGRKLSLPIEWVKREHIRGVEDQFTFSPWVKKAVGVGGVAEPAAFCASDRTGNLLIPKQYGPGVTLAVWEERIQKKAYE